MGIREDLFHEVMGMLRGDEYKTANELVYAIIDKVQAAQVQGAEPVAWVKYGGYTTGNQLVWKRGAGLQFLPEGTAIYVGAPLRLRAVAYLDVGAGGYIDIGSNLAKEQLEALPMGRHMLGIVGTYGIDGYVPARTEGVPEDFFMGMREEFEKVFPLPKGVYWEDWGNGDGQYEVTVDVDELLADMQQARFQGWQAALTQSEKSAEPEGFDFDGWYDKHQSLFRDGMGKSDLRAAYKQGYRDSQPAQQGVPEETEAMVDAAVKVFEDAGAKVDLGWLGEACRAYVAASFTPATPQPAQQGSVPEDVIRQCEDAIQYASEIRGGCISGVREAQKRVRAILDTSQRLRTQADELEQEK